MILQEAVITVSVTSKNESRHHMPHTPVQVVAAHTLVTASKMEHGHI
jgi:hypothetical protein